jgi:hypothetical protein
MRIGGGLRTSHKCRFLCAPDICNTPDPLFTGLRRMMQNLPFVRQSGLVIVGTLHHAPEQNCDDDENDPKNNCFAHITGFARIIAKLAAHP